MTELIDYHLKVRWMYFVYNLLLLGKNLFLFGLAKQVLSGNKWFVT